MPSDMKLDQMTQERIVDHITSHKLIHEAKVIYPQCSIAESKSYKNASDKYFSLYEAASDDAQAAMGIFVFRENGITYRHRTRANFDILARDKAQAKAHLYAVAFGVWEFFRAAHPELLNHFPSAIIDQAAARINEGTTSKEIEKILKQEQSKLYESLEHLKVENKNPKKTYRIGLGASEICERIEAYRDMGIAMRDPASIIVTVGCQHDNGKREVEIETPLTRLTEEQAKQFIAIAEGTFYPYWFNQLKSWQKTLVKQYAWKIAQGTRVVPVQIAFLPVMRNFWEKTDAALEADAKDLEILGNTYHSGAPSARSSQFEEEHIKMCSHLIDEQIKLHIGTYGNVSFMQTDPPFSPDNGATKGVLELAHSWFFGIGSSNITNIPYALWGRDDTKKVTNSFIELANQINDPFNLFYIKRLTELNQEDGIESHIERAVLMQLLFDKIKNNSSQAVNVADIKELKTLLFNCKSGIDRTGIFSTMLTIYRHCEYDLKKACTIEKPVITDEIWNTQFIHSVHAVLRNSHAAFMTGQVTPGVNGIKEDTIIRPFPLATAKNRVHYITHFTANLNHSFYGKANQGNLKKIAILPASFYLMGIAATGIEDSFFNSTQHFYDEDPGTIAMIFLSLSVAAGFYTFFAYHLGHKKEQFSFTKTELKTIASLLAMGGAPLALEEFLRLELSPGMGHIAAMAAIASVLRCLVVFLFELEKNFHSRNARFDFKHYALIALETFLCVFAAQSITETITGEITFQPTQKTPEFLVGDHMELQAAAAGCGTAAALSFGLNWLAHYKKLEMFSDKSNSAYVQYNAPEPPKKDVMLQLIR